MEADLKTAAKKIEKALKSLINKSFACEADALSAVTEFEKTLKFHNLSELQIGFQPQYSRRGRPSKNFGEFLMGFYTRRIKRLVPALVLFVLVRTEKQITYAN